MGGALRALAAEARGKEDWAGAESHLADALRRYNDSSEHWRRRIERAEAGVAPAARGADAAAKMIRVIEDDRASVEQERAEIPRRRAIAALEKGDIAGARTLLDEALKGFARAKASSLAAAEALEKLSAEQPASAELRRSVSLALHSAGLADAAPAQALAKFAAVEGSGVTREQAAALHEAALASYTRALEIAEGLFRSNESNQQALQDVANYLNKVGNELRDLGRLDESQKAFERSLSIRSQDFKADPSADTRARLGVGQCKVGEIAHLRSDGAPAAERARLLRDAESAYAQGRANLREALGKDDAEAVKEADATLARIREKLGGAGG